MNQATNNDEELYNRLMDLESRHSFQEDTINQLNAEIYQQQLKIERLEQVVDALKQVLQTQSVDGTSSNSQEEPPPHY